MKDRSGINKIIKIRDISILDWSSLAGELAYKQELSFSYQYTITNKIFECQNF